MKTFQIVGGDIVLDDGGRPTLITGQDKLTQDVLEWLLVGTNQDGYGAGMGDLIGTIPPGSIPSGIVLKVIHAAEYYQSLQRTQIEFLNPSEMLVKLVNVTADRVSPGRTDYAFKVFIQNGTDPTPSQVCILYRPPTNG